MRAKYLGSALAILATFPSIAHSQYQGHVLQSPFNKALLGNAASGGGIAGQVVIDYLVPDTRNGGFMTVFDTRAAWWPIWSGLPIVLDTVEGTYSEAIAISGTAVAGQRNNFAALWPMGTPDNFVDLTPIGGHHGRVLAMDSTSQGGWVVLGNTTRPVVWFGSAASAVDLLPPSLSLSDNGEVRGVAPGVQVGRMFTRTGNLLAYMWHGTAASGVDKTPPDVLHAGFMGTDGAQHVGYVVLSPVERERAAVWNTDANSWSNIHPVGFYKSLALACRDGVQVGEAWETATQPVQRAALWRGTAESYLNLHQFLPPQFTASVATGIDENGVISGYATSNTTNSIAVVWVPAVTNTAPTADAGADVEATYSASLTVVQLDGSGSSDPDAGDLLTYEWKEGASILGSGAQLNAGFSIGTHEVVLTVTDSHGATSTDTVTVKVVHSWSGPQSPINADGSSIFKLGSTVPVKFSLTGGSASAGNVSARLYVAKVSNDVVGTEEEAGSTSNADVGNVFRYNDGQFMFNWGTKGLTVGTWRLRVDLGDGALHTVMISLK